jgi:hypothetical protein
MIFSHPVNGQIELFVTRARVVRVIENACDGAYNKLGLENS